MNVDKVFTNVRFHGQGKSVNVTLADSPMHFYPPKHEQNLYTSNPHGKARQSSKRRAGDVVTDWLGVNELLNYLTMCAEAEQLVGLTGVPEWLHKRANAASVTITATDVDTSAMSTPSLCSFDQNVRGVVTGLRIFDDFVRDRPVYLTMETYAISFISCCSGLSTTAVCLHV